MSKNVTVQNSFQGGLKSEYTGLNFPENSATAASNVVFSQIGDVTRRNGINYETNFTTKTVSTSGVAINTYKWNNVGGDGQTQIVVEQIGGTLYFYLSSAATIASPLSTQILASTVTLTVVQGSPFSSLIPTNECQFADGNGYLFVYHPYCDPLYCVYNPSGNTVTAFSITIQTRDFNGIPETGVPTNSRPSSLTNEHSYNLQNQGWINAPSWSVNTPTSFNDVSGVTPNLTVTSGLGATIAAGQNVKVFGFAATIGGGANVTAYGTVVSYNSGTGILVLNLTSGDSYFNSGTTTFTTSTNITIINASLITAWNTAIPGTYPSNSDVWWTYKNTSGVFSPSTSITTGTATTGPAPKGSFILNEFTKTRSAITGLSGLTDVITYIRPKNGTWFQGRVWYTGVDASFQASGDEPFQTWTENIYFSQIIENSSQFGYCYQVNDPTSETLFAELSSDGGVITIQGSGSIYKLFAVQNGLLVFAANGIWFITGSVGVGFSPIDYTITKLSSVQSISCTSYVDVLGYPYFWNEEGIYEVIPEDSTSGRAIPEVRNIVNQSIQAIYAAIPFQSKKYARGSYNPTNFVLEWVYRSTNETNVTSRYQFDSALCQNQVIKAFYPYLFSNNGSTSPFVHGILYVSGPGGSTSPNPVFKYPCGTSTVVTFAEENDNVHWLDWYSVDSVGIDYTSTFTTGYNIHGKATFRWQPEYVYVYSNNKTNTAYIIQGIWDYAQNINSGKVSTRQTITNGQTVFVNPFFGNVFRRHRIRGRGIVFQLKITSVKGQPFDILGWSLAETINDWT